MKINYCMIILSSFFVNCSVSQKKINNNPIISVLESEDPKIKRVVDNIEEHEVQIIVSEIIRKPNGTITFNDYSYNLDSNTYFYPASTVKFPIAILALEKLNEITNFSEELNFKFAGNDERKFFNQEIIKIFALSDNEASNNLQELIGFDYLNDKMKEKGLSPFRIQHRLATNNPDNPNTIPLSIFNKDSLVTELPASYSRILAPLELNKIKKGQGYLLNDTIKDGAFDFSKKNYYPLETLHNTMKRIVFPDAFQLKERFNLLEKDRKFILSSMQKLPREQGFDENQYYDSYCKFLIYGDTKERIDSSIKIYNKIGQAYGTLTDCAYIVDEINQIELIISATILVNKNKIFNDGIYEYEEVGLPFLAELGRQLVSKYKKK
jgi:hypothetical protein